MAIGYARTESVNRAVRANGKRGNAVASSAYAARAKMVDESTGVVYDFRRLAEGSPPILLPVVVPDGQPGIERQELWTKAEQAERQHNSTVARCMIGALPNELDADAQQRICYRVAEFIARAHGVAVDAAIHRDTGNNHVHFLFTSRRYEDGELGAKTRELDVKGTASKALRAIRKFWQDGCNFELEAAGFAERIDMRSYEERGQNRLGQIHIGSDAWHHQNDTGANDKAARNEERKEVQSAREELKRTRQEIVDNSRRAAELEREIAEVSAEKAAALKAGQEAQAKEITEELSSIFLSPEETAEQAKKQSEAPPEIERPEPAEPKRASIFFSVEEEAELAKKQQPKPATPTVKNPVAHPIFIMPEETRATELYSSLYRFFGGDVPVEDLIADIGQFRRQDNLAMLNHVDANGNRFTHLSSAVIGKLHRDANGEPGKMVSLRRFLKVCKEIEAAWESAGGKLDRKAHNGSGQSPNDVRDLGLGNWRETQRGTVLLHAIDDVSTGAISDSEFFDIAGKMRKPETAACFDGVTVNGKGLDDLLRQLMTSPRGRANPKLLAMALRSLKKSKESGRVNRELSAKLDRLFEGGTWATTAPPSVAAMAPWAAPTLTPTSSISRTGTARIAPHQPRALHAPVGTPVRVAYKPTKRQRMAQGAGAKWRAGYAQLERISRNQVGHGFVKLPLDHGVIQMPTSQAVGGMEPALPLAEVGRRTAAGSQQNLKPGMWLIPPGASPQERAAIEARNKAWKNAIASEFSEVYEKKFTRD